MKVDLQRGGGVNFMILYIFEIKKKMYNLKFWLELEPELKLVRFNKILRVIKMFGSK